MDAAKPIQEDFFILPYRHSICGSIVKKEYLAYKDSELVKLSVRLHKITDDKKITKLIIKAQGEETNRKIMAAVSHQISIDPRHLKEFLIKISQPKPYNIKPQL